ncbi:class I SAM-dependent methyltransferase [Mucilaginibacter boryungensis]|uniref:Class I SAM-dependent methyltransferase n=1 Tax=Mucilaginibacter boryungensis TaxID=768480 RepID=A0ABR9XIQ7_9SPHI|nr:class I SAM-dependent methyltransferase [Mucilaginibacter boryungensis]MBE9667259.1 class I SAM-dependent methyltransferase [Mucilaginibacter boryungensis]
MSDSTQRFSNRVDNYIKYRPGYPVGVLELLHNDGGLKTGSKIADIGSGTGILTRLLLDEGYTVYAVEPNGDMRQAADAQLGDHKRYHSINGTAEATTLQAGSIDMVTCAQAFHWFNAERCRVEFARILKPGGKVALIWNNRQIEADEFSIDYEFLLRQESSDYKRVNHQNLTEADFTAFFKDGQYQFSKFPNVQVFDEAGLIGRAFSSSYVPAQATPEGETFLHKLKDIFNRHQENETVSVQYQTEVYLGEV